MQRYMAKQRMAGIHVPAPHNLGPFVFVVRSLVTSPGSAGSLSYPTGLFLFGDPRGSWKADSA